MTMYQWGTWCILYCILHINIFKYIYCIKRHYVALSRQCDHIYIYTPHHSLCLCTPAAQIYKVHAVPCRWTQITKHFRRRTAANILANCFRHRWANLNLFCFLDHGTLGAMLIPVGRPGVRPGAHKVVQHAYSQFRHLATSERLGHWFALCARLLVLNGIVSVWPNVKIE